MRKTVIQKRFDKDYVIQKRFDKDCKKWRGKILTGKYAHRCWDWDGLPVDETTVEFTACSCFDPAANPDVELFKKKLREGLNEKWR